ncbi:MAG: diguanylate cyclase [Deltaproteobacteria bacterium]|nr:diguanylate cyclase [Deltaproteobacteria bacterium]
MDTQEKEKTIPSILIVDDNDAIRESIHQFLTMAGYNSFTAPSAESALEFFKKNSLDVVITDIMMNGMDGLELTERIKKKYDADVIVMTGFSADYSYEEAINIGASDFVFKPVRFEELLLRLKRVLKERQLSKDRIHMLNELKKLAITDDLTGLYNSRHFYAQLEIEVNRSKRYSHPLSLLLLDIDHFKDYNDTYGHVKGDQVLVMLGKVIQSCLRRLDTAYRYGGEEFTIILPETMADEAAIVAERIKRAVKSNKLSPEPGKEVSITISIGVTEYAPGEDLSIFVHRADKAMYISKQEGRDRITYLNPE